MMYPYDPSGHKAAEAMSVDEEHERVLEAQEEEKKNEWDETREMPWGGETYKEFIDRLDRTAGSKYWTYLTPSMRTVRRKRHDSPYWNLVGQRVKEAFRDLASGGYVVVDHSHSTRAHTHVANPHGGGWATEVTRRHEAEERERLGEVDTSYAREGDLAEQDRIFNEYFEDIIPSRPGLYASWDNQKDLQFLLDFHKARRIKEEVKKRSDYVTTLLSTLTGEGARDVQIRRNSYNRDKWTVSFQIGKDHVTIHHNEEEV